MQQRNEEEQRQHEYNEQEDAVREEAGSQAADDDDESAISRPATTSSRATGCLFRAIALPPSEEIIMPEWSDKEERQYERSHQAECARQSRRHLVDEDTTHWRQMMKIVIATHSVNLHVPQERVNSHGAIT